MKEPIFLRSLSDAERAALRSGLRSGQAFTVRRSQILSLSADRHTPRRIARQLGCTDQTVRNVIRALRAQKKARDRLIRLAESYPEWVLGYADEVWWSRLRQPRLSSWAKGDPLPLIKGFV